MLLIFLLILLLAAVFKYPKNHSVIIGLVICIVFAEGLRWESATDFWVYFYYYINILKPDFKHWVRIDVAYFGLAYVFSHLKVPYIMFQLLCMAVAWGLYYKAVVFFKGNVLTGILFLYAITLGLLGGERQWLAMAIFLYGVTFLVQGRTMCYLLAVGIATLFHVSAMITLPLVLLTQSINKNWWFALLGVILLSPLLREQLSVVLIQNKEIFGKVYAHKISYYFEHNQYYQPNYLYVVGGVFRRLLPVAVLWYIKPLRTWPGWRLLLNISVASILLYLFCVLNFEFLLGRLTIYYSLFDAIIFSWVAAVYAGHWKGKWIMAGLVVWAVAIFIKSIMPYPELFIPYKTYFGTF